MTIERMLFVIGKQNSGKSTQLRSMFVDPRFGTKGSIPKRRRSLRKVWLSRERTLLIRMDSPHEKRSTVHAYLAGLKSQMRGGRRWCLAASLQPDATKKTLSAAEIIGESQNRYRPERVRACLLSPDMNGGILSEQRLIELHGQLRKYGAEVITIDATAERANGLILADFFDFS